MTEKKSTIKIYIKPEMHGELRRLAEEEGISMNQLVLYLLTIDNTAAAVRRRAGTEAFLAFLAQRQR